MKGKILAFMLLTGAVAARGETVDQPETPHGDGHGWVAPTVQDKQVLRENGSRLQKIFLTLRGFGRLVRNHGDSAPGATPPPPNGQLVRPPGMGIQYRRYTEAPGETEAGEELTRFPRAVDNSTLPCFPPIFYQGELNSCTSVAVTYYQLTHMTGLVRGWDQKRTGAAQRFSPLWTFNLINGGNNHGTFQSRAYAALLAHGAVTLKEMPYYSTSNPATNYRRWSDDPKLWQQALEYRIDAFGVIQESNVVNLLRRMKQLLVNGHVLTAATAIDGWNKQTIIDNPSSRLDNPYLGEFIATAVAPVPGNHCITIVGYNDDIWVDLNGNGQVDPGEKGALKIANSWGTSDWNRGFRWLHYAALYAPRDPEEAQVRQAALYANQSFWMSAARDYKPELVIQVDLPPMYRNEFRLTAGVGTFKPGASETCARNFAFDYNGGRFSVDGRKIPQNIRAVLDVTRPATRFLATTPEFFVHIDRPGGAPVVPRARLIETSTGTIHELMLARAPQADTYSAQAPSLAGFDTRQLQIGIPAQVDIVQGDVVDVPINFGDTGDKRPDIDVKVFSCNASVLAANDLAIERDSAGHAHLRITRPSAASGSCALMVYGSDGLKSVNTTIRVNLLTGQEAPPAVTLGTLRQEALEVHLPFKIKASTGLAENVFVFFDVSNVDQVVSYEITGKGVDRELNLKLRYRAPFELSLSALDGRFVSAIRMKVEL